MIESLEDPDLAAKALFADQRRDFRPQNLYRDSGLSLQIVRENDICRGTSTNQRLEGVAFRQTRREPLNPVKLWRRHFLPIIGEPSGWYVQ